MAASFFFYDLETSGISPRSARVMQFAGQRTDLSLKPIGEPVNMLIKLTPDVLPDPEAILLTGITPQKTLAEGYSEAEFLEVFHSQVVRPETIFVGFNSVRFDDEFMRFLNFRNFYDPYEWQWKDGNSRWDLLDVVRMTRALRPEGIKWPYATDGKPSNRLELLTATNKIDHVGAHDALADVKATIAVAALVKSHQPELFKYLLSVRDKRQVADLIDKNEPFIYTSGHFSSAFNNTTAVVKLAPSPHRDATLVYDLRFDPEQFISMGVSELEKIWEYQVDPEIVRLPVKTIKHNRVPAVAPLGVIKDKSAQENIGLELDTIAANYQKLLMHRTTFQKKVLEVVKRFDEKQEKSQAQLIGNPLAVDERLYEGFIGSTDKLTSQKLRSLKPDQIKPDSITFSDERLNLLLPLYKARNYPKYLDNDERLAWEDFCNRRLTAGEKKSRLAIYFDRLSELAAKNVSKEHRYLLEELQLYGQSLVPLGESDNAYH